MSDFIANKEDDYIGLFAVTAGINLENEKNKYRKDNDDYSLIMMDAVADRFAEAFTEYLHHQVSIEFWGYQKEDLDIADLHKMKYQGIRPAPGYPVQPDHTEKETIWKLLNVEKDIGIKLTESYSMYPTASVCGLFFSHPESHYFSVNTICQDQIESYSKRKGQTVEITEKWLSPILGYRI